METPLVAIFVGSSVTTRRLVRPPARSTDATPSRPCRSGTTSVAATFAAAARPSGPLPEMDAMRTGEALMSRELTCGVTFWGSAAFVPLTFVPYENWATTMAIEFADVDWTRSRRGMPEIARSIGLATWSATSANSIAIVVAQFSYGTNVKDTKAAIAQNVAALKLPQNVTPQVSSLDINASPVIIASISGSGPDGLAAAAKVAATEVVPDLQSLDGVCLLYT